MKILQKKGTLLIIAGLVVVAGILIYKSGVLRPKVVNVVNEKQTSKGEFVKYQSPRFSYSIEHPQDWKVDATQKSVPADMISSPLDEAEVFVQTGIDSRLSKEGGFETVFDEVESEFAKNNNYQIEIFDKIQTHKPEFYTPGEIGGYAAAGSFEDKGQKWRFKEYGVFTKDGKIYIIRGNVKREVAGKYGGTVDKIMNSFDFIKESGISQSKAIELVKNLPAVQGFQKELAKKDKNLQINAQDEEKFWLIQVFEIVDSGEDTHTATFNWYQVDKKTGKITSGL